MLRRSTFIVVVVMLALMLATPALAAPPPTAEITSAVMELSYSGSECGVEITATLANVGHGRYWVVFGFHSAPYGTTITFSDRLDLGQSLISQRLGVCDLGGSFDRGDVALYRGGRLIASESVEAQVTCPSS